MSRGFASRAHDRPRAAGLRVAAWRGDHRVAHISPTPENPIPSVGQLRRCIGEVAADGYSSAFTAALPVEAREAFLEAGFREHESLYVLAQDMASLPPVPELPRLRRARRSDREHVLALDNAAFDDFWRFDDTGLDEAIAATPVTRFRVSGDEGSRPTGYAICGRAGPVGYLQRLAVAPEAQGHGVGTALVADALAWLNRRGARRALVNTQAVNDRALQLYLRLGFEMMPEGLTVMRWELGASG